MAHHKRSRAAAVFAGITAITLTAAACGSSDDGGEDASGGEGAEATVDCAAFESYGDLSGTTVSVYASIVAPEDQQQIDSYKPFEECTGATVEYQGSRTFEADLPVRVEAGNAPDVALIPQPGLVASLVTDYPGKMVAVGEAASANVDQYYDPAWKDYGTVDGTYYAVPVGANVKSFVWYSPSAFADNGYEVPETWDDLLALTEQIASEKGTDGLTKPWCAGIESGGATGWPATDWLEDIMLRTAGPDVYDQWYKHEIPFNDAAVATAMDEAGKILKNEDFVNGGLGGVQSIATTSFGEAGLPILDGTCYLHRQASFFQAQWSEGTTVAEDGDVFAFYLPAATADEKPLLVGGEFAGAFRDAPEVQAFLAYLASPEWSNAKAEVTPAGWLSANKELDISLLKSPIDQLSAELIQDESAVIRFDGSDLMPAAVGAGSFWKGMTDWIANDVATDSVLSEIEGTWPSS